MSSGEVLETFDRLENSAFPELFDEGWRGFLLDLK